jgi:elongator complex protein 4
MSFRKRNIGVGRTDNTGAAGSAETAPREHGTPASQDLPPAHLAIPGTRPSPVDGRLTTSTGTPTLDTLLAGHAGLPLGHSIILEENGTTDYTGSLLKYYAAEGIVQGHTVHIVGIGEGWTRGLPGLVGPADHGVESVTSARGSEAEKMKIAWRYEKLGRVGEAAGQRGGSYLEFIVDSSMIIIEISMNAC